ncbi:hypothetical protein VNO78_18253 [Psophocarpus tetragonolobus]|uniref:mannan endo-1,4-beta-mannosidase n=1 Tax=Psophocarpus tetragonolobus TaxID=3891 RepID=A0AAN9SJH3_PSOTE
MRYKNLVLVTFMMALVVSQLENCKVFGASHYDHSHKNTTTKILQSSGFIQRKDTHFFLNGKPYYFNGFNAYWLMNIASDPSTNSKVTIALQEASQHGLNVARTWAFHDGGYNALQISPGSYNENVFKGLDFVISAAGENGIRLILTLVNNWKDDGGKTQYVQWARERGQLVKSENDFFTHPVIKQYYKNHVKTVLTRKNTVTGLAYKDDPTIFAWELMNEPRSRSIDKGKSIQDWVKEMAVYVKSIDRNHLLEVGLEGFYGESTPQKKQFNPSYESEGTDFISNNQFPEIDFTTIHLYSDQWLAHANETTKDVFINKWVEAHVEDSNDVLRKPILISEFGKSSKSSGYNLIKRNIYFEKLYNFIFNSASKGGACAGGLFWQLLSPGMDNFRDGYEVIFQESPSTANIIAQQSKKMSNLK